MVTNVVLDSSFESIWTSLTYFIENNNFSIENSLLVFCKRKAKVFLLFGVWLLEKWEGKGRGGGGIKESFCLFHSSDNGKLFFEF